eukprot:1307555-Pyramimonas_sp.AAC.1
MLQPPPPSPPPPPPPQPPPCVHPPSPVRHPSHSGGLVLRLSRGGVHLATAWRVVPAGGNDEEEEDGKET